MEDLIMSRYRVIQAIGEGGLGRVYYGWDEELQRPVAIKRLRDGHAQEGQHGVEGWREARTLAALQHPNIVTLFDFGFDGRGAYFIMEYLQGEDLEGRLRRGALGVTELLGLAHQVLEGLLAAHASGVIHRDLKPSNLMLVGSASGDTRVKILDFGLARFQMLPKEQTVGDDGSFLGSIFYMAPEQFARKPLDERTDLYALGHVLYHALAGRPAHQRHSIAEMIGAHLIEDPLPIQQVREDVAPDLADWLHRLMEKAPDRRPDSALEALRQLRSLPTSARVTAHFKGPAVAAPRAEGNQTPEVEPSTAGARPGPVTGSMPPQVPALRPASGIPAGSRRGLWVGIGAVLLLLAGGGGYFLATKDKKTETASASTLPGVASSERPHPKPAVREPIRSAPPVPEAPPPKVVVDVKPIGEYAGGAAASRTPREPPVQIAAPVAPPPAAGPGGELAPTDLPALRARAGQSVTVAGTPVMAGESKSGTTFYLNFSDSYREALALVFFMSDHPGLTRQVLEGYVGKPVRVSGRVEEYQGRLQIVVPSLDALRAE